MGNLAEAVGTQENHLSFANTNNNLAAKIQSLSSLGRLHFNLGQVDASVSYLQQALADTEGTDMREDEAIIRHRLGMALWTQNLDLEEARLHLDKAAMILEMVRRETISVPKTIDGRLTSNFKLSLFDLQTECYQVLQTVLVSLGKENEALVVAERARTRAFVDLLMGKQQNGSRSLTARLDEWTPSSESQLVNLVNRQKASVIYYSIAAGHLYSWLVVPIRGIIKFNQVDLSSDSSEDGTSTLDEHIQNVRESLGIDTGSRKDTEDMDEDMPAASTRRSSHLDAMGEKLNGEGDRTGFLRMVNRSSRLNASSYSLSSLFSVGSVNCGSTVSGLTTGSRHGSVRSRRSSLWQGPSAVKALYSLLIEPMEDDLPEEGTEIMLVLESNLFMVPWSMLKGACNPEYLCERYCLLLAPSLTSTKFKPKGISNKDKDQKLTSLVVGNPKLPTAVSEHWGWADIPKAGKEAETVAEILQTPSANLLTGDSATKSALLAQLSEAECVHFACHVSWQLSAVVLSPGEFVEKASEMSTDSQDSQNKRFSTIEEENEEPSEPSSTTDMPALSDFLLTAADILNCKLSAKLVVLSSGHSQEDDQDNYHKSADGLIALTKAILAAGAQCVLVSLWPVPDAATNVVMRALYSALLQGTRISRALADAIVTVQNTKHFAHPANWAGFTIIGSDIRLSNRVALMGQALRQILSNYDSCRDVLRVTLHLVEKSLQRIHRSSKTAMYTSQQSIEKKVHASGEDAAQGWKDLLMSVGFRFEPASNGIPSSVFFPQNDPGERLTQCSASLQAILGLNQSSWKSMSKLCDSCPSADASDEIIALFRQVNYFQTTPLQRLRIVRNLTFISVFPFFRWLFT
jgi:CHAT domain-containing protein